MVFSHILIGLFVFLVLSFMSCLYILEINPLSVVSFILFSHSEGCLFILLRVSFAVHKLLSFIQHFYAVSQPKDYFYLVHHFVLLQFFIKKKKLNFWLCWVFIAVCRLFSSCSELGLLSSCGCGTRASHCSGFPM